MAEKRIFGIDLGTTYSEIAYINKDGRPETIRNAEGELTLPSVVQFDAYNNVVVGKTAKSAAAFDPDNVISFVKRQMGTDWTFPGNGMNAQQISSFILKRLADDAKVALSMDCDVEEVVITCPAYFGEVERNATAEAGKIAGLNVLQILDEPVAAALHYAMGKGQEKEKKDRNVLVYDLGGGTFDATVLAMSGSGGIRVVCTQGDHRLGGGDWDQRIADYLASQFEKETGQTLDMEDLEIKYDLLEKAEDAKKCLTRKPSTIVPLGFMGEKAKINFEITTLDEITADLLERTYQKTDQVLEEARQFGFEKIDEILLVGGSTRMLQVMNGVKERYAAQYSVEINPFDQDEAVAKGAAILATMKYIQKEILNIDHMPKEGDAPIVVTPEQKKTIGKFFPEAKPETLEDFTNIQVTQCATKSYGVELVVDPDSMKKMVCTMIAKQSPLPARSTMTAGTLVDNQNSVRLPVFYHDESVIRKNDGGMANVTTGDVPDDWNPVETHLCMELSKPGDNLELQLPPGLPKGSAIEIIFEINDAGRLEITAREPTSNRSITCFLTIQGQMSEEEIQKSKEQVDACVIS